MATRDVTDQVRFGINDDECLPLTRCVCGAAFVPWQAVLGVYRDQPWACPVCGRRLYFGLTIRVYEVLD